MVSLQIVASIPRRRLGSVHDMAGEEVADANTLPCCVCKFPALGKVTHSSTRFVRFFDIKGFRVDDRCSDSVGWRRLDRADVAQRDQF